MARRLRKRIASSSDDEEVERTNAGARKRLKKASEGGGEDEGRQRHNLRPRREKDSARAIRERMRSAREARKHRSQVHEIVELDESDLRAEEEVEEPDSRAEQDENDESFIVSENDESFIASEGEAAKPAENESEYEDDEGQELPSHRALINEQMNETLFRPVKKNFSIEAAFSVFYEFLLKCCVQPTYAQICFQDSKSQQGMDTVAALSKIENYISDRKDGWVRSECWSPAVLSDFCTFSCLDSRPSFAKHCCEVCNRDRTTSAVLTLQGPRYDSKLSSAIQISKPLLLAPSGVRSLSSGRFCCARALLFHRLQHYSVHTLVALKARFDRMTRETGSLVEAKKHMQSLESEFFTVFQELVDLSERYRESGQRYISASFSELSKASLPSLAELQKYLPFFFPSPADNHRDQEEGHDAEEVDKAEDVISAFKRSSSRVKVLQSLGEMINSVEELRALLRGLPSSLRDELRNLLKQDPVRAVDPSQSPLRSPVRVGNISQSLPQSPVRAVDSSQSPLRSPVRAENNSQSAPQKSVRAVDRSRSPLQIPVRAEKDSQSAPPNPVRAVDRTQSPLRSPLHAVESQSQAPATNSYVVVEDANSSADETLSVPPNPSADADDTLSETQSPVADVAKASSRAPPRRQSKQSSILQFFTRKC